MRYLFSAETWLAWFGATIVAVLVGCAWAFAYFETKQDALDKRDQIIMRLNRIENKIDAIQGFRGK